MVATEQGREVLRHALRVMAELEEIRAVVADEDAPLRGHVSIGMPPTASDILSEPLVSAFRDAHPDATLRIVSAYTGYLLDWMQRGELDAAILYDPKSARNLRVQPLLEETLFLIGPPASRLSLDQPIAFAELETQRMLLPSRGHGLRTLINRYAQEAGISLNIKVEADSYSTLKALVHKGHGVTVLPLAPIHAELEDGSLSAAPLTDPVPVRRLVMSYPTDRPIPRLARFAAQAIETTIGDLVARGIWSGRTLESGPAL
jgi:DNA-binding transcriptional LysR family regulator